MVFILIGLTLLAWLVHAGISSLYTKLFNSTYEIGFRLAHGTEIFIVTTVMLVLYQNLINSSLNIWGQLATVLGTLIILDGAVIGLSESLRQRFDIWHFAVAYVCVALAVILAYKIIN